ncbi:hypothetical protein Fcan01_00109 [Folsomia candida]|uniref:Uncharacterized protein n=1 Tax=Folsomia candida TaxID=158441 RepID=A0A226F4X6_FOLCA|nr:hypothetical protein Fcan01_00109 [Folsomia candida]
MESKGDDYVTQAGSFGHHIVIKFEVGCNKFYKQNHKGRCGQCREDAIGANDFTTGFVFHRIILSGAFGSPIDKGQKVDKTGMLIFSHALINHNPAHLLVPENDKNDKPSITFVPEKVANLMAQSDRVVTFKVGESGGGLGGVGACGDGGGRAPHYTLTTCDGHYHLTFETLDALEITSDDEIDIYGDSAAQTDTTSEESSSQEWEIESIERNNYNLEEMIKMGAPHHHTKVRQVGKRLAAGTTAKRSD